MMIDMICYLLAICIHVSGGLGILEVLRFYRDGVGSRSRTVRPTALENIREMKVVD
jgi:hypothetical protein